MKAIKILEWICNESIEGEHLNIVEVPEEGKESWQQNEDWWIAMFGMYPPSPVAPGRYLYYYTSAICDEIDTGSYVPADASIELPTENGFDYIYLYLLEE